MLRCPTGESEPVRALHHLPLLLLKWSLVHPFHDCQLSSLWQTIDNNPKRSKSALALSAGHLGHTLGHGGKVCHGEVPADEMIQESNDFCTWRFQGSAKKQCLISRQSFVLERVSVWAMKRPLRSKTMKKLRRSVASRMSKWRTEFPWALVGEHGLLCRVCKQAGADCTFSRGEGSSCSSLQLFYQFQGFLQ